MSHVSSGVRRHAAVLTVAVLLVTLAAAGCGSSTSSMTAAGPFAYPSSISPPLERVAILVSITNRSSDDQQVNPADFVARDGDHRIYPANPVATAADGELVRLAIGPRPESLPLPTVTLREQDVLSGFVVFDVPAGVHPVELIWRQSDTDEVVPLAAPR